MITYLRMSSAWHKGMVRPRSPGSLAGDGAVAAGGQGLLDVPGHAFGPRTWPWSPGNTPAWLRTELGAALARIGAARLERALGWGSSIRFVCLNDRHSGAEFAGARTA